MNPRLYYSSAEKIDPNFEVLDEEYDDIEENELDAIAQLVHRAPTR